MDILIAGLGNPGSKYDGTRHNIGWDVLNYLDCFSQLQWREKFKGLYASFDIQDKRIHFLKPLTFMNLSGQSVSALMQFYKIELENILIIHDELDLPYGTIAFKNGGGLAGHNGLKSIAKDLASQDFLRLRMGIGRPVHGSVSHWVLSHYDEQQNVMLPDYFKKAAGAIELFMSEGFQKAASEYSKKQLI